MKFLSYASSGRGQEKKSPVQDGRKMGQYVKVLVVSPVIDVVSLTQRLHWAGL